MVTPTQLGISCYLALHSFSDTSRLMFFVKTYFIFSLLAFLLFRLLGKFHVSFPNSRADAPLLLPLSYVFIRHVPFFIKFCTTRSNDNFATRDLLSDTDEEKFAINVAMQSLLVAPRSSARTLDTVFVLISVVIGQERSKEWTSRPLRPSARSFT